MKISRNLCLHGQDGKKWKENYATKVTKIPKTKRRKYVWDEQNIRVNVMLKLNYLFISMDLKSKLILRI